eukprot:TRINITY_DN40151_c0_g1_i2.p1 TRINITY_DN40151_c0_g1~~TRINITY_DN40151_c0_g1_i2.p1  ORF type:complete len:450 (-),score=102.02 TRINITY_DN40151_c0_g1_i2:462-1778(-)
MKVDAEDVADAESVRSLPSSAKAGAAAAFSAEDCAKPRLDRQAERILALFYDNEFETQFEARQRLERNLSDRGLSRPPPSESGFLGKWNRQELQLQPALRASALHASRRHLAKHREEWRRLSDEELWRCIGTQHHVSTDVEDMQLPKEKRRSDDRYGGPDGSFNEQFLLDCCRGTYVIDGQRFDFSESLRARGLDLNRRPLPELEELKSEFVKEICAALQRCLGACASVTTAASTTLMMRAITTEMSQSGMANLERAWGDPQVAVCGGESTLYYELCASQEGIGAASTQAWDLELSVRKTGFEMCLVCDGDNSPQIACSANSFLSKAARIRFQVSDLGDGRVDIAADVFHVGGETHISDECGRLVQLPTIRRLRREGLLRRLFRGSATIVLRACDVCGLRRMVQAIALRARRLLRAALDAWRYRHRRVWGRWGRGREG